MLDLRAMRGAEFCEVVRRMVEERWVAREAVPPWDVLNARREAELEGVRRELNERLARLSNEDSWEFVNT